MNCHCKTCIFRNAVFDQDQDTELHRLIMCEDFKLDSIRKLLKRENVNARDAHYDTPLHLAAVNENKSEVVMELIKAGAQVQMYNASRNTPLHVAALHCNARGTEVLLQSGADANSKNILGNTALHSAARFPLYTRLLGGSRSHAKVVIQQLMQYGADVDITNKFNETPLYRAVETGNFEAVQELLKYGANTNICNGDLTSCLHIALCKRNPDQKLIKELVKNGANINCRDKWFRTPLDLAILRHLNDSSDELETAMILVKIGVLVRPEISINMIRIGETVNLYGFYEACSSAVNRMQAIVLTEVISMHDFALRGMRCTVSSYKKIEEGIYSKVLQALLTGKFGPYDDIIQCYLSKSYLKKVVMNIRIVAKIDTNQEEIQLLSDVVWMICDYLDSSDMFRLIKASSIVESNIL